MSQNHHDPIPHGSPANSDVINTPFSQLDEAISKIDFAFSGNAGEYLNGQRAFSVPAGTGDTNGHVIQAEGVDLAQRAKLDFQGASVKAQDGGSATEVLINGAVLAKNIETLIGNKILTDADAPVQFLDPGGSDRDVMLPPNAAANPFVVFVNTADAAENLVIKNNAGTETIVEVAQGEVRLVFSDGSTLWATNTAGSGGGETPTINEDGWLEAGETWTYSSVDDPTGVFTVPGDVTSKYFVGMRIKMTNDGNTIYGIISKIPIYSSPNTTITFLHEIDPSDSQALYLMVNSAITNPKFSTHKAPHGFPISPLKWSIVVTDTTERTKASPAGNTWYYTEMGSINISVPIGLWKLSYDVYMQAVETSGTIAIIYSALSTSNNSLSDARWRGACGITAPTGTLAARQTVKKSFIVDVPSKTLYYLIASTPLSSMDTIYFSNDIVTCVLTATSELL